MTSRLAQLEDDILARKQSFDRAMRDVPRDSRHLRLELGGWFTSYIAPLVAEREALLGVAAHYDPLLDSIRQWRKHD